MGINDKRGYLSINDYELIYMIHQKDETALTYLFEKYEKYIWSIVRDHKYKCGNYDLDDLFSIANLKLYDAVWIYAENKGASFYTFITLCITRALSTLKRNDVRELKNRGTLVYLDDQIAEDSGTYYVDQVENNQETYNPIYKMEYIRLLQEMNQFVETLNKRDRMVWYHMIQQKSYQEASKEMGLTRKQYDNIVYRMRKKLSKFMKDSELD